MCTLPTKKLEFEDVIKVRKLSQGHPVYLVTLSDGHNYVVKRETGSLNMGRKGTKATLRLDYELTHQVAGGTKARMLTSNESFQLTVLASQAPDRLDADTKSEFTNWRNRGTDSPDVLVLMNVIEGLKELGASFDQLQTVKILRDLEDSKNLKRLGRIIAVDLFIGNEDRFVFAAHLKNSEMRNVPKDVKKTDTFGTLGAQTVLLNGPNNVIQNVGNIVFKPKTGGDWELIGFDPYDTKASSAKLDTELAQLQNDLTGDQFAKWSGVLLKHKNLSWLQMCAKNALLGVKLRLLQPWPDSNTTARSLYTDPAAIENQVKDVMEGLEYGLSDIKNIVQSRLSMAKRGQAKAPAGLESRAKVLKWRTG
jgi:hypothetical protein